MSLKPGDGYDPWITFKKFLIAYGTALVSVLIPFSINFIQDYEWPPDVAIYIPIILAFIVALENAWKHWND